MNSSPKEIAKFLIEHRTKLNAGSLEELASAMHSAGGKLVEFEPDGDWCGTGHFPHWPPKGLDSLAVTVAKLHGVIKLFPRGIPVLDSYDVLVSRINSPGNIG